MFISVSKNGDRYSFIVGDKPEDDRQAFFQSHYDFDLVNNLRSDYGSYAEAHSSGLRLIKNMPSSIMARKAVFEENTDKSSPEERVVSHFSQQVNLLGNKMPDIEAYDEEERKEQAAAFLREIDEAKKSIKGVMEIVEDKTNSEILEDLLSAMTDMKIRISKYAPEVQAKPETNHEDDEISVDDIPDSSAPAPLASATITSSSNPSETLLAFGTASAKALVATHKTAHVKLIEKDEVTDSYFIHIADKDGDVCSLKFNSNMLLTSLVPSTRVAMVHPYHCVSFMERYWEPITMAVGHYLIPGKDLLISHDEQGSSRRKFSGTNIHDGSKRIVTISSVDNSWWIKDSSEPIVKTASTDSEIGYNVRCIRKNLPTYYGRTGLVIKAIPRADHLDVVVDFGRGLGTLVLKKDETES